MVISKVTQPRLGCYILKSDALQILLHASIMTRSSHDDITLWGCFQPLLLSIILFFQFAKAECRHREEKRERSENGGKKKETRCCQRWTNKAAGCSDVPGSWDRFCPTVRAEESAEFGQETRQPTGRSIHQLAEEEHTGSWIQTNEVSFRKLD